jgi:hypothetical protein
VTDNSIAFAKKLLSVPSRHFLPLVYQIASRLNRPNEKGLAESENLFRRTIYDVCISPLRGSSIVNLCGDAMAVNSYSNEWPPIILIMCYIKSLH